VLNQSVLSDDSAAKKFRLVGGNLSLDFINTVGGKREGTVRENLHTYCHFLSWCEQAGLVDKLQSQRLKEKVSLHPDEGVAVLGRALALRESIYRIFLRIAKGGEAPKADLAVVNSELAKALGRLRVASSDHDKFFSWQWSKELMELDHPLGPISHSAAGLLVSSGDLPNVRQCSGNNCGWLFLDSSRNHSRCWCDMRDCGNRAKVRRHRHKQKREDAAQ